MPKKRTKHFPKSEAHKEIKHKSFWGIMSLFFFLSITIIIISSENTYNESHVTGNAAIQVISFAQSGTELTFEVRNVPNLYRATAQITDQIKNGKIEFKEDTNIKFDGTTLSKFIISSTDEKKVSELRLMLKIKEEDLKKVRIKEDELSVYVNKKKITTVLNQKKDGYLYYIAASSKMGDYVIGKAKEQKMEEIPQASVTASFPTAKQVEDKSAQTEPAQTPAKQEESTVKEQPLAGQAIQTPQQTTKPNVFQKIGQFFKSLFQ